MGGTPRHAQSAQSGRKFDGLPTHGGSGHPHHGHCAPSHPGRRVRDPDHAARFADTGLVSPSPPGGAPTPDRRRYGCSRPSFRCPHGGVSSDDGPADPDARRRHGGVAAVLRGIFERVKGRPVSLGRGRPAHGCGRPGRPSRLPPRRGPTVADRAGLTQPECGTRSSALLVSLGTGRPIAGSSHMLGSQDDE